MPSTESSPTNAGPAQLAKVAIRLRVEIWLHHHGWLLPIACILLIASTATGSVLLSKHRDRLAMMRAELAVLARTSGAQRALELRAVHAPGQALHELFRRSEGAASQMQRIAALAREHQIDLPRGEYSFGSQPDTGFDSTAVTLTFVATYPRTRTYVEALMRESPNVSLDRMSIERGRADDGQAEISLHLTMWRSSNGGVETSAK